MDTKRMTKIAIVAAMYVVMTISLGEFSAGVIQFRYAEILNLLAFISPIYIIALTLGCMIANFFIYGVIDMIVGGAVTLFTAYMIYRSRSLFKASFWPLLNGPIIGLQLYFILKEPLWISIPAITISEFIIMVLIAYPLFKMIYKQPRLIQLLGGQPLEQQNKRL